MNRYDFIESFVSKRLPEMIAFWKFDTEQVTVEFIVHLTYLCKLGFEKRLYPNAACGSFIESVYKGDLHGVINNGDANAIAGLRFIYYFTHTVEIPSQSTISNLQ